MPDISGEETTIKRIVIDDDPPRSSQPLVAWFSSRERRQKPTPTSRG
jgi:hypothetical protein